MTLSFLLNVVRRGEEPTRSTQDTGIGNTLEQLHLELRLALRAQIAVCRQKGWVVVEVDAELSRFDQK